MLEQLEELMAQLCVATADDCWDFDNAKTSQTVDMRVAHYRAWDIAEHLYKELRLAGIDKMLDALLPAEHPEIHHEPDKREEAVAVQLCFIRRVICLATEILCGSVLMR